ncbi:MAG: TRAP transporter small permease [Synergistaceae bacterium]|jgi:TRAP-type C4-dicarboxylate transport system permease small subunit|nr:TRAP transporter small permease [Synergistaceae bacterium]
MTVKKFLNNFEEYCVVWTMALMTVLVFCQVVMRYVFSNSLSWSEELARFIFMWLSWVGASYAVKERSHFRVEMFANLLKGRSRKIFELAILAVWFAFSVILAWLGTRLTLFLMETGQISAAMEIPMSWVYASVPAGCALMAARLVVEIVKILKSPDENIKQTVDPNIEGIIEEFSGNGGTV